MCPSPKLIVKNSVNYFKKWIENSKYLIEEFSRDEQYKQSFTGNNVIVVQQAVIISMC